MISPRSQNEIISVIGYDVHVIRANIISEVKEAMFFSVLADEVSCHNAEHLPLCLRFVDKSFNIEKSLSFVKLLRVRAIDIANAIISTLEELGLSLQNLRVQGYDGAATMSGEKSVVQKQLRDIQPKALYTHCTGHSINLAIVSSCAIPSVSNCIDTIKSMTIWIRSSPKREGLLKCVYENEVQTGSILNVCITCWVKTLMVGKGFHYHIPF